MKIYQIVDCSCDGGRIGKTCGQYFFFKREDAESALQEMVESYNAKQYDGTEKWRHKPKEVKEGWDTYKVDTVDGISGYCQWRSSTMLFMREVEVT